MIKLLFIGCGGIIAKTHMQNIINGKCPSICITAVSNRTYSKAVAVAEMLEKAGIKAKVYETDSDLIQHAGVLEAFALANAMVLSHWKGETVTFPFDEHDYLKRLKEHY